MKSDPAICVGRHDGIGWRTKATQKGHRSHQENPVIGLEARDTDAIQDAHILARVGTQPVTLGGSLKAGLSTEIGKVPCTGGPVSETTNPQQAVRHSRVFSSTDGGHRNTRYCSKGVTTKRSRSLRHQETEGSDSSAA